MEEGDKPGKMMSATFNLIYINPMAVISLFMQLRRCSSERLPCIYICACALVYLYSSRGDLFGKWWEMFHQLRLGSFHSVQTAFPFCVLLGFWGCQGVFNIRDWARCAWDGCHIGVPITLEKQNASVYVKAICCPLPSWTLVFMWASGQCCGIYAPGAM